MADRVGWLAGLRRWRRAWIALGVLVFLAVATRVALPYVLRWQLSKQASQALHAQVDIGDVDLALLRGGVALIDVAVRPLPSAAAAGHAPPAAQTSVAAPTDKPPDAATPQAAAAPAAESAPATIVLPKQIAADSGPSGSPPGGEGEPPIIAWKRFAVELQYGPLRNKVVRLRDVELDSPYVAVDRLATGDINLTALVPKSEEPAAQPTPAAEAAPEAQPSGWAFGIDRFALRQGNVQFRDMMIKNFEPINLGLGTIEVTDIAIQPETYGRPAEIHLEMKIDEGALRVDAKVTVNGPEQIALVADITADALPLRRSRVYIPEVGWSDLQGRLAAALKYELETKTKNQISGSVALQDVSVKVPDVDLPAIQWKNFEVKLDTIDLVGQRAAVSSVTLANASIPVRLFGDEPLPILRRAAGAGVSEPPPSPTAAEPAAKEEEAKPWQWSLASLQVTDATAHILGGTEPIDLGVNLGVRDLSSASAKPAAVQLAVAMKEASLNVDGAVKLEPIGFDGSVKIQKLDLAGPAVIAKALPPNVLQSAQLDVDLKIQAGSSAPQTGDVRASGKVSLTNPRIVAANPKEFLVAAKSIDISIQQVNAPGVVPPTPTEPKGPIAVQVAELRIVSPEVQVTRTADGIVLPEFSAKPAGAEAAPTPQAATAEPTPATLPSAETAPAAAPVEVELGSFKLTQGRIGVLDRTVKPFYVGKISPLNIDVQGLRWPEIAVKQLRLDATSAQQGKLQVTGSLAPGGGGQFEANVRDFGLVPFNPYATAYSPYSVTKGSLTVTTKGSFGKGGTEYKAESKITLHDLDVGGKGGDSVFQEQFGIPLSMALSLLRDVQGNIVLDLPVAADEKGTKVGLATVVAGVLRRAIVNALASPLKLFGAVLQGDKVQSLAPPIIQFRAGRDEFAADGAERAKQLGAFLSTRPGVQLTLQTAPTKADEQWLREQAVLAELEAPQGFFGTIRNLGQGGTRDKIRAALEARANDEKGELDPEDAKTLDEMLAKQPPIAAERLTALADGRLARVEETLRSQSGIGADRVTRQPPPTELSDDAPVVRVEIGSGGGETPDEGAVGQADEPADQ